LKSFNYRLWDEQGKMLVGYGHLRTIRARANRSPQS
jgi:hypothetical protein